MSSAQINQSANQNDKLPQSQFLKGLRDLVLDETIAQREQIHARWRQPLVNRVLDGYAIDQVSVKEIRKDGLVELSCTRNISRFRPGDILCLNRDDPFAHDSVMVNLVEDEETELVIATDQLVDWYEVFTEREGWVLDIGFVDLSSYILTALANAGDTDVGRTQILPLLMGENSPDIDPVWYARGLEIGEDLNLNWSQSEALANAYATDLAYLVQGPPGTGKTRVLASLARALAKTGERVLICSFTHRAINNALNAVYKQGQDIPVIKIGHPIQASDLQPNNYETFHLSPLAAESKGYIVGATPFATQTKRLSGVKFETVIFDEASQITLPLAVMGMLAGEKYIFFGDQKQMPPVLTRRLTGGALRESIFAHLADRGFDTMLTETYRLNDVLTQWPSRQFYDEQLTAVSMAATRRLEYPVLPERLSDILDANKPMVFWDLAHRNTKTYSQKEANAVVDLIINLLNCGIPAPEIGVVAPYRAQGRLIRNLLRTYVAEPAIRQQLIVDTVERMQGQERDVIIISLTTSNPGFAANVADFFFQPERLNVAITRPRKKLIIIGSRFVLNATTQNTTWQQNILLFENLLENCTYIPDIHEISPVVWESSW